MQYLLVLSTKFELENRTDCNWGDVMVVTEACTPRPAPSFRFCCWNWCSCDVWVNKSKPVSTRMTCSCNNSNNNDKLISWKSSMRPSITQNAMFIFWHWVNCSKRTIVKQSCLFVLFPCLLFSQHIILHQSYWVVATQLFL